MVTPQMFAPRCSMASACTVMNQTFPATSSGSPSLSSPGYPCAEHLHRFVHNAVRRAVNAGASGCQRSTPVFSWHPRRAAASCDSPGSTQSMGRIECLLPGDVPHGMYQQVPTCALLIITLTDGRDSCIDDAWASHQPADLRQRRPPVFIQQQSHAVRIVGEIRPGQCVRNLPPQL